MKITIEAQSFEELIQALRSLESNFKGSPLLQVAEALEEKTNPDFGDRYDTIENRVKRLGSFKGLPRSLRDLAKDRINELHLQGLDFPEIAEKFGIKTANVYSIWWRSFKQGGDFDDEVEHEDPDETARKYLLGQTFRIKIPQEQLNENKLQCAYKDCPDKPVFFDRVEMFKFEDKYFCSLICRERFRGVKPVGGMI